MKRVGISELALQNKKGCSFKSSGWGLYNTNGKRGSSCFTLCFDSRAAHLS